MSSPVSEKVAIVTGTSSGIGLYTAILLAQAGFKVVATMRNLAKSGPLEEQARKVNVEIDIRQLDVLDDASIESCVQGTLKSYGRLDLLVNNAGAGYLGTLEQTSIETLREVMETNFFGVWKVTQAVLPTMREARSGRIISITSVGGLIGQPFNEAYCAAKFAVEGFMESLAPVVKRLGIEVVLIEPGPVNTEFVGSVQAKLTEMSPELAAAYGPMQEAYLAGTQQAFATIGQTPAEIGQVIVEAATTDSPHLRYCTSEIVRGIISRKYVDPTGDSVIALTGARLPKL
jgi:NAD(P)-dependent dehydrogenase (short-subunit alcohol dehydrogenase family)